MESGNALKSYRFPLLCEMSLIIILPSLLHHRRIATVTCTTCLAEKHIEIMTMMISFFETLSTQGHTGRYATCTTAICYKVWCPYQTTSSSIIIGTYCKKNTNFS